MRLPAVPALIAATMALAPLSMATADVYRSVDGQGHVLYSDFPTPGAELVKTHANRDSSPPPPVSSTSKPAAKDANKPEEPVADAAAREAAARSVANDVSQTREQQCAQAKDQYEKAVAARRIYNTGPNGERQFLTDDQAQEQRVNAKLRVDELCNNSGG